MKSKKRQPKKKEEKNILDKNNEMKTTSHRFSILIQPNI